jgi:uncharacterized protein (DUF1330 family)
MNTPSLLTNGSSKTQMKTEIVHPGLETGYSAEGFPECSGRWNTFSVKQHRRNMMMNSHAAMGLGLLAGIIIGGAAIDVLHAQAKPPVYYVAEIEVSNPEAYAKEYVPKAQATIKASGGRYVAIGGAGASGGAKVTPIEGDGPKNRVVIQVWDSLEKVQAWRNSPEYKQARKIGDKYAKFRSFVVDGVAQ